MKRVLKIFGIFALLGSMAPASTTSCSCAPATPRWSCTSTTGPCWPSRATPRGRRRSSPPPARSSRRARFRADPGARVANGSDFTGPDPGCSMPSSQTAPRGGGERAEVFVEDRSSLSLRLEDGKIEDVGLGRRPGRVRPRHPGAFHRVRLRRRGRRGALCCVWPGSCRGSRRRAAARRSGLRQRCRLRSRRAPGAVEAPAATRPARASPGSAALLRLADQTARGLSGEVRQVVAVYGESRQRVWIARSDGARNSDERIRKMIAVSVMAQRGALLQVGRETLARAGQPGGLHRGRDRRAGGHRRAEGAHHARFHPGARPGACRWCWPTVSAGVLFHEACGHGLEADYILKKTSVWEGKHGQRVAGEHVFAYDDGVGAGHVGQRPAATTRARPARRPRSSRRAYSPATSPTGCGAGISACRSRATAAGRTTAICPTRA